MMPAAISSSATQGISGNAARRPARMIFSLARSASVTGELVGLRDRPRSSGAIDVHDLACRPRAPAARRRASIASSSDAAAAVVLLFGNVALVQPEFQGLYHLLGRFAERLEMDFRFFRRFIRRIDAGEILDLAIQRPARRGPSDRAWRIPRTACRRTPRRTRPRPSISRAMRRSARNGEMNETSTISPASAISLATSATRRMFSTRSASVKPRSRLSP